MEGEAFRLKKEFDFNNLILKDFKELEV